MPSDSPAYFIDGHSMSADYREALSGKTLTVMDIAVDGSGYLVLAHHDRRGDFIWEVDKDDIHGFLPIVKTEHGIVAASELDGSMTSILRRCMRDMQEFGIK